MKKNITRSVLVTVAAAAVGAGSLLAAGQAHAAGDLGVNATVKCQELNGKTYTQRLVAVTNHGPDTATGVRVGSVAGPEATVPKLDAGKPEGAGGLVFASTEAVTSAGTLKKGQTVIAAQTTEGCGSPYAILGYAIGDDIQEVFSGSNMNIDFDWGMAPGMLAAQAGR